MLETYHVFASLLSVHEALGNHIGCEQFVTLSEFLERNSVWEALSANTDALKHTVAPQLVKHQRCVDLSGPLLVVGDDASHKVGVGVAQSDHQLGKLLLVQLRNCAEHALSGSGAKLSSFRHGLLGHANNFSCKHKNIVPWIFLHYANY